MDELIRRRVLIDEFEWLKSVVNESSRDEIEEIIQRIKNAQAVDAVSKSLYDQIKWERDIAIEQLEELGLSLGQKIDGVYLTKEKYDNLLGYVDKRYKYGKNLFVDTKLR